MSHTHGPEKDFEKLSRAITEAVMTSEKVKKIAAEIQKKEDICPESFMVLVLKLQILTDSLEVNVDEMPEKSRKKSRRPRKKSSGMAQFIDGQQLTTKEIKFQEFANERFDAQEWLKKNGLIF
ncbi:MAG: hypothetical protein IIA62_11585 [Nitrospinae bacterium]|nr:hypothetical protein [Nitrospinota bacterium]